MAPSPLAASERSSPNPGCGHGSVLRPAKLADAGAIAALQLAGWRLAYAGVMPSLAMAALSLEKRLRSWRAKLASPPSPEQRVWVIEEYGQILGFLSTRPSLDPDVDPRSTIEIHAVYVRPDLSRRGLGRALLSRAADDARRRGFEVLTLWVVEANTGARRFYEAAGMAPDGGERIEAKDTASLLEVRYRGALATLSKGTP